jgi:hypothetical protein
MAYVVATFLYKNKTLNRFVMKREKRLWEMTLFKNVIATNKD